MEGIMLALKYANDFTLGKALVLKNGHVVVGAECIHYRMTKDRDSVLLEVDGHWEWIKTPDGGLMKQTRSVTIKQIN